MKHSIPFKFKSTSGTSKDGGPKVYKAIASTDALDRDREVLLPKGCVTEEFLKNPVMLRIHDYGNVPVAKVHAIDIDEKQVSFSFEFYDDEEGKKLEDMYVRGFMSAFSVGLYPLKAQWIDPDGPKSMELEVADGTTQTFSIEDYKETPRRVVNQWELLEISPVPVPSNPEALLIRAKENIVRKFMDGGKSAAEGKLFESQLDDKMKSLNSDLDTFLKSLEDEETVALPKAVPVHETIIDKEAEWDTASAKGKMSKWASSDDTGLKATVDWGMYAKGFAFVNTEKAGNFTSYKFAHHTIDGEDLVGVWKGITLAMSELLGDAGKDLDEDDRAEVYAHLAAHYKDAGTAAPALNGEYSDEDLTAIAADTYKTVTDDPAEPNGDGIDDSDKGTGDSEKTIDLKHIDALIKSEFAAMTDSFGGDLKELEETVRIRLSILLNSVEEVQELLSKVKPEASEDLDDGNDGKSEAAQEQEELDKRFQELTDSLGTIVSVPDTNQ